MLLTEDHLLGYSLSDDAVAALSEKIVLFVKFSVVLPDGHVKALLLKVWLLLFANGGFFQNLSEREKHNICLRHIN